MGIFSWHRSLFFILALCGSGLSADVAVQLPPLHHATLHDFANIERIKKSHHLNVKTNAPQSAHASFGSKTAHLMELKKILKPLTLPHGYTAAIPPFLGIAHHDITSFLKDMHYDLEQVWQEKIVPLNQPIIDKESFLKQVEKIGTHIESMFSAYAQNYSTQKSSLLKKLKKFINPRISSGKFITVRSTGKEDTDTVTNAGGNESKEIVQANIASVLKALGAVLASYFSQKSFAQRLAEADSQLFETPLLAVLIQEVVGEFDGTMVAGGVAYTQENLGNTPGVALVQATHGHCKAVVDSIFPSDTFYVHNDGTAVSILAHKTARFVPNPTTARLDRVTHDKARATSCSLDEDALAALSVTLQAIHASYGKPMDVEFVIDQTNTTIWIVQARPLKQLKQKSLPTYIHPKTVTQLAHNAVIRCCKINEDDGTVRHITDAKKIIVAHKLDDALMLYLDEMKTEKTNTELVIVQGNAQATSHAAATLKGCGVAILCVPDSEPIKEMLALEKVSLFIDLQQALIINGLSEKLLCENNLESLIHKGIISLGRFNHPIPSILSVSPLQGPLRQGASSLHEPLYQQILQSLVEELKDGDIEQAIQALLRIQSIVQNQIDYLYTCTGQRRLAATHALKKLHPLVLNLENIYHLVHEKVCTAPRSLERLYPIALLEALLFQEKRAGLVKNYSFQSVISQFQEDLNFLEKYADQTFCHYTALKLARLGAGQALTQTIADQWVQVIAQQSERKLAKKVPIITFFEQFKMLPLFINMMFANTNPKKFNRFFKKIAQEFKNNQKFLEELTQIKTEIDALDINDWLDSKNFTRLFDQLNSRLIPFCTSTAFNSSTVNTTEKLSTLAALSLMETIISYVDLATKAVKSRVCQNSNQTDEKCTQFKQLLESYFLLLAAWAPQTESVLSFHDSYPPTVYLKILKHLFENMKPHEAQFLPSKDFNVTAAALGSAAAFYRCYPQTLEDVFTTIHQSLLNILGALVRTTIDTQFIKSPVSKKARVLLSTFSRLKIDRLMAFFAKHTNSECYFSKLLNSCLLGNFIELIKPTFTDQSQTKNSPVDIHVLLGVVSQIIALDDGGTPIVPSLTGVTCTADATQYTINIPLRNHSATIKLIASHKNDVIRITVQFYGLRKDRWCQIHGYVKQASKIYQYTLDKSATVLNENGISFSLATTPQADPTKLHDIIKNASLITFRESNDCLESLIKDLLTEKTGTLSTSEVWNKKVIECFLPTKMYTNPDQFLTYLKNKLSPFANAPSDEEILHQYVHALCSAKRTHNSVDLYQLLMLDQTALELCPEDKTLVRTKILQLIQDKDSHAIFFGCYRDREMLPPLLTYFAHTTDSEVASQHNKFFEHYFVSKDHFTLSRFKRNLEDIKKFPALEQELYSYIFCNNKLITAVINSAGYLPYPLTLLWKIKDLFQLCSQSVTNAEILSRYIQVLCERDQYSENRLYQLIVLDQACSELSSEDRVVIKKIIPKLIQRFIRNHNSRAYGYGFPKLLNTILSYFAINASQEILELRKQFFESCFVKRGPENIPALIPFPELEQVFYEYFLDEHILKGNPSAQSIFEKLKKKCNSKILKSDHTINKLLNHKLDNDKETLELFEYLFDEIYFLNESCQKVIIQKAQEHAAAGASYAWELEELLDQHASIF